MKILHAYPTCFVVCSPRLPYLIRNKDRSILVAGAEVPYLIDNVGPALTRARGQAQIEGIVDFLKYAFNKKVRCKPRNVHDESVIVSIPDGAALEIRRNREVVTNVRILSLFGKCLIDISCPGLRNHALSAPQLFQEYQRRMDVVARNALATSRFRRSRETHDGGIVYERF